MAFTKPNRITVLPTTPGELYRDLPRRPNAVPGLWAHQSEVLNAYMDKVRRPDVALELPTGTGKTLIGLLIAEWNRQQRNQQVLYACPTRQLAEQVRDEANREGIDTALLTGSHANWDPNSKVRYESARHIGITTYSSIFNSHPKLTAPSVLLFDDAHAGEQYVGEAYSLRFIRDCNDDEYRRLLRIVAPAIDEVFLERLNAEQPSRGLSQEVRLVVPLRQPGMVAQIIKFLSRLDEPYSFRYSMIEQCIASCLVYVSYNEILVRPYIPPTHQNHPFRQAEQRVYLSATLGEGGELERAFGRHGIDRLHQPGKGTVPRSGRRFFVFPESTKYVDTDKTTLSREIVSQAGKALILSQRTDVAMSDAKRLAPDGWPIFGIDDVSTSMEPFADSEHAICALAARYDGLDLPGDTCRLVLLDGKPDQLNLQEIFLQRNAQAGVALDSRIRTRIIQGIGRCTRGPEDTAIVMILGNLSDYLAQPTTRSALSPELQAEIMFGLENSQDGTDKDMLSNVRAFLNQNTDDTWRSEAEPTLIEYRRTFEQSPSPGSQQLSECVAEEIEAWECASVGSWRDAAQHAHAAGSILGNGGSTTRRYQAFWKYLESAWTDMTAEENNDPTLKVTSKQLLNEATTLAGKCSWIAHMSQFPDLTSPSINHTDAISIKNLTALLSGNFKENKFLERISEMQQHLALQDASKFESALSVLGQALGAEASKPAKQGRCDSVWCWGNELWLALEAKSEHKTTGVVSIKDVRQSNGQLQLLADDRACSSIPADSAVIIISPKPGVHRDAMTIASENLYLTHPDAIRTIAADTAEAWKRIAAERAGKQSTELRTLVTQTLRGFNLLPSDVLNRLTITPVGQALHTSCTEE